MAILAPSPISVFTTRALNVPVNNPGVNDFVVVKVYSLDSKWKNFIAQIIDGPDEDGDFEAFFFFFETLHED